MKDAIKEITFRCLDKSLDELMATSYCQHGARNLQHRVQEGLGWGAKRTEETENNTDPTKNTERLQPSRTAWAKVVAHMAPTWLSESSQDGESIVQNGT